MLKRKCCECGKWFREDEMIQDSCSLFPPIIKDEWYCEKCYEENEEYEREQGLRM
ncbi:hypothetical protein [Anaerosinus massiliensis]|uniref:hypothetical protein n=1 Tax=Massilibacillus massiliensis TaxID=1806837 RepID=UPI0018FE8390|nr:hypothetical protein [Massilibacillus massiliensis]